MRLNPLSWLGSKHRLLEKEISELKNQVKDFDHRFGVNLSGNNSFAVGEAVTLSSAIKLDTVYACIRDKSESIGQLPIIVKRNGVKIDSTKREHKIFAMKPNDYQTMQELVEMYVTNMESRGNFYLLPIKNSFGNISQLLPLYHQDNVHTYMNENGRVVHTYTTNDNKPKIEFAGDELIHFKLNSGNGVIGISPIMTNAISLGISLSQERYLGSLMESSAMPKGLLHTDSVFKDPSAIERLKEQWGENAGAKNAGKTPVMENGLKYQVLGLSPADTELIKQRTYSKASICGIFRVPPHRIGLLEATKFNNPEQNNRAYLSGSLIPLIVKFEMGINIALNGKITIHFDTMQFARGDRLAQVEALAKEFSTGSISMNTMRTDLGRDEIEGGDVHAIDTNNFTFGKLIDIPKLQEQARQQALAGREVVPETEHNETEDENNAE